MPISVRVASLSDIGVLVGLNREVQQLHAELEPARFRTVTTDEEVGAFFAAKLALPGNHIRLARDDGGPDGYVWFELQERPETTFMLPRRRIYIHQLAVRRTAHRRGLASALLGQVEMEAHLAGIIDVALDTWAANGPARGFFGARGFAAFNLVLGKSLA